MTTTPDEHSEVRSDHDITYDVRKGAAAYAPIVGGIAAIAVAGVVLVFTTGSQTHGAKVAFVAGLFVLTMVGCLVGAFGFAGLSSEEQRAPNLLAGAMWIGAAVVVAMVALMAGFEVLADLYVPSSKPLFVFGTFGVGVGGAIYVALSHLQWAKNTTGQAPTRPSRLVKQLTSEHAPLLA